MGRRRDCTNRRAYRTEQRRPRYKERVPFCTVFYYDRWEVNYDHIITPKVRYFDTYANYIAHATAIELGLKKETHPWKWYKVWKFEWGYRQCGQTVVEGTTIVNDIKVELNERASLRRDEFGKRRLRQYRNGKFSVPKNRATNPYVVHSYYTPDQYSNWSSRSTATSSTTYAVGTSTCTTASTTYTVSL